MTGEAMEWWGWLLIAAAAWLGLAWFGLALMGIAKNADQRLDRMHGTDEHAGEDLPTIDDAELARLRETHIRLEDSPIEDVIGLDDDD